MKTRKQEIHDICFALEKKWLKDEDQRFWQLLRNVSGWPFIHFSGGLPIRGKERDTFFTEDEETLKMLK